MKWIGFDCAVLYAIVDCPNFNQGELRDAPVNSSETCLGRNRSGLACYGNVGLVRPRLGLIVTDLQMSAQLLMQIIECGGWIAATQPGDPGLVEISLVINRQIKRRCTQQARRSLKTLHLREVNITDEMQRQVQVGAWHPASTAVDRDSGGSQVQALAHCLLRPQRKVKTNILLFSHECITLAAHQVPTHSHRHR